MYAFGASNLGTLLALEGAEVLRQAALPAGFTIVGIILLTGFVNIFVGSVFLFWVEMLGQRRTLNIIKPRGTP